MTTDDFENPDSSPVPPYDRNWRHPAEVADSHRSHHLGSSPPLGRRLTALTVIASALTSIAVLTVAIPKGIEGYAQDSANDAAAPTTTIWPIKGSQQAQQSIFVLTLPQGTTSAIPLGNNEWLVASEALTPATTAANFTPRYSVVRHSADLGLSVIRINLAVDMPALAMDNIVEAPTTDDLADCHIVDSTQAHVLASEPSLASEKLDNFHPVNIETRIKGLAIAINKRGHVIGVLVRKGHAQWVVSKKALREFAER